MTLKINEDSMALEVDGAVIATARRLPGGSLVAGGKSATGPRFFDRNQAITALTVTELLATERRADDPLIVALRKESR
jgi:hypothetical protein